MSTKIGKLGFGFILIILAVAPTRPAWSAGWELVFSDEFDGDKLDRNKWATRYIYQNETMDYFNDEKQRYRDNHLLSGGALSLIAKKIDGSDLFESAMIRSHRTFYYGYYEARVFLPSARGIWPAFWLEGDYDLDGKTWHPPEIDIFEYVINGVEDKANSLHSNTAGDKWTAQSYTFVDRSFFLKHQNLIGKEDLNQAWHTAGFVWAPDRISFFWDGRLIYTRMYQWLRRDGQLGPPAHVDLNFAVGGKWAGRHGIDEAAFPQTFKIDYVRVCQFTSSERGNRQCGPSELTPDPKDFGYSASLNDMAKPAFLPALLNVKNAVADRQPKAGVMSLNTGEQLNFEIPIKVPENYPGNRMLQVSIYDEATGTAVASANRKLQDEFLKKSAEGASVVELSLPAIRRPGNYFVAGKLTADIVSEKGAREVLPSPVTCSTDVIQPIKARSCRLLSLQVQSR